MKINSYYIVNPCALNFDILENVGETKVVATLKMGDTFQINAEWKTFDNNVAGYSVTATHLGQKIKGFIDIDTINYNKNCVELLPEKPVQKKGSDKSEPAKGFVAAIITSIIAAILSFLSFLGWFFGVVVSILKAAGLLLLDGVSWLANQALKRPFFFALFLLALLYLLSRIYANLGKGK